MPPRPNPTSFAHNVRVALACARVSQQPRERCVAPVGCERNVERGVPHRRGSARRVRAVAKEQLASSKREAAAQREAALTAKLLVADERDKAHLATAAAVAREREAALGCQLADALGQQRQQQPWAPAPPPHRVLTPIVAAAPPSIR